MILLYLSVFFTSVNAIDYATHLTRKLNHNVSACENFYRHVCPTNFEINYNLATDSYNDLTRTLKGSKKYAEVLNKTFVKDISRIFRDEIDSVSLATLQTFSFVYGLTEIIAVADSQKINGWEFIHLRALSIFQEMKGIFLDELLDTPWVKNHGVLGEYEKFIVNLSFPFDVDKDRQAAVKLFSDIEDEYLECKNSIVNGTVYSLIDCLMSTFTSHEEELTSMTTLGIPNAVNKNTYIIIGLPYLMLTDKSIPLAVQLGSAGFVIGHEMGHTFIDVKTGVTENELLFSYFSKNVLDCVRKQFQSGCQYFNEGKCFIEDKQLDESGSDLIGYKLSYEVLRRRLGENKLQEQVERLNVTHQQLYFYSAAMKFCQVEPSVSLDNVYAPMVLRINAMVQLPEFQQAFNCEPDSKMMLSKTEQCHIFGAHAPQSRR